MVFQIQGPPPPQVQENQSLKGILGGLGAGLEKGIDYSINEYFDQKKKTDTYRGAGELLEALPKDYRLEDILTKGKELGIQPDAIGLAASMGKTALDLRQKQQQAVRQARAEEERFRQSDPAYKEAVKSYKTITDTSSKMKNLQGSIQGLNKLLDEGAADGTFTPSKAAEIVGRDTKLGRFFQSREGAPAATFNSLSKSFVDYFKTTFGNRITDRDLAFISSAVPSLLRSKESNKRILDTYSKIAEKYTKRAEVANKIIQQNGGRIPTDLEYLVDLETSDLDAELEMMKAEASPDYDMAQQQAQGQTPARGGPAVQTQKGASAYVPPPPGQALFEMDGVAVYVPEERAEEAVKLGAKRLSEAPKKEATQPTLSQGQNLGSLAGAGGMM